MTFHNVISYLNVLSLITMNCELLCYLELNINGMSLCSSNIADSDDVIFERQLIPLIKVFLLQLYYYLFVAKIIIII